MPTWIDGYKTLQTAMAKANGTSPTDLPRVTNEQAASILRATMQTATKHKFPAALTERWYELALSLAGWNQPGDKFLVTAEHRRMKFPDADLPLLWQTALNVASTAQNKGLPFSAPTVDPSSDYTAVLKQAWSKMQREARDTGQPAPSSPLLPAPSREREPEPERGGDNELLIALGLLWALGHRKGRR